MERMINAHARGDSGHSWWRAAHICSPCLGLWDPQSKGWSVGVAAEGIAAVSHGSTAAVGVVHRDCSCKPWLCSCSRGCP